MRIRTLLIPCAAFLGIAFLLMSCDSSVNDWKNAKSVNSITEYQKFINKHSSSVYAADAQNAVDSLEWVEILKTQNVDSLTLFIKNHSSSKFLTTSKIAMDSIEWKIAYCSKDTVKLISYINKYPNSTNKQKAEDIIWELKWPPVKIGKANSVYIMNNEEGIVYGASMFYMGNDGVARFMGGDGPNKVYIWRNFTKNEISEANKHGLRAGLAYLRKKDGTFKFIRKIDLSKSDKQLCLEFAIKSESNRWFIKSLLIPKLRPL